MFQFAGSIGFCVDVGDFLQFQGAFQGYGVVQGATQEEGVFTIAVIGGKGFNLVHMVQDIMHLFRHGQNALNQLVEPFLVQGPLQGGDVHGQQQHNNQLGGVGFGGGYGDFGAGVGVHGLLGFPGNGGAHHVGNGQGFGAAAFGFFQGFQGIAGFAGLADHDAQAVFIDDGVPVAEFAGNIDFYGNPGHFFNIVLAHNAGVIGGAAGYDKDLVDVLQGFWGPLEFVKGNGVAVLADPAAEGIPDGFGLFVDFLQHEVFKAAFFGCFGIPGYPEDFLVDGVAFQILDCYGIRGDDGHFAVT